MWETLWGYGLDSDVDIFALPIFVAGDISTCAAAPLFDLIHRGINPRVFDVAVFIALNPVVFWLADVIVLDLPELVAVFLRPGIGSIWDSGQKLIVDPYETRLSV